MNLRRVTRWVNLLQGKQCREGRALYGASQCIDSVLEQYVPMLNESLPETAIHR